VLLKFLKYSSQDHRGHYKKVPNHVEAFGPDGKSLGVAFETATPFETPGWMKELVDWFNQSISEEKYHPLILIGIFVVVFLAIHPSLQRRQRQALPHPNDASAVACRVRIRSLHSMEGVIEGNKDNYYLALRRTQQTIRKEKQNWEYWLVFFLKTMAKQKDKLAAKVKEEQALRSSLPALSRQILELAKTRGEITVKEIEDSTGANRNTIKVHVKKLAGDLYLTQVGKGRGARYTLK
jgi:Fic family protein